MRNAHVINILRDGSLDFRDPDASARQLFERLGIPFRIESVPPPRGHVTNLNRNRGTLDEKAMMAREALNNCKLCGWRCGANRFREAGQCGLREKAYHETPFVHIGEEAVINPAWNIQFYGCSWKCSYCQTHELLSTILSLPSGSNDLVQVIRTDSAISKVPESVEQRIAKSPVAAEGSKNLG